MLGPAFLGGIDGRLMQAEIMIGELGIGFGGNPLASRCPGRATLSSAPTIGWMPAALHASPKAITPYSPLRSATAIAGKPRSRAAFAIALGSIAPSSMVKLEKTRRGTKGL
jgi:hypothetical protein